MKELLLRARVVVRSSNMKISRRRLADYVKNLHQKACRTCSTTIFPYSANRVIAFSNGHFSTKQRNCGYQVQSGFYFEELVF